MLKILSIGNSFSQDAHKYLHALSMSLGKEIHNVNLYIGGCSLERHHKNMVEGLADYTLEEHGVSTGRSITLEEGLLLDEWDYVTLQQVSSASANFETYKPYARELADYVRRLAPRAKILVHQTWSYGPTSLGRKYGKTRDMFSRIERAYKLFADEIGADGIIPAGETMERMKNRGYEMHRDGRHAALTAGRYAIALTWYNYLFGEDGAENNFTETYDSLPKQTRLAAGECAKASIENLGSFLYPIVTNTDIPYAENRTGYASCDPEKKLDLYLPDGVKDFPTFVYFHGGGFVNCDKTTNLLPLAKYLTDRGIAFVSANYRMYPNARYPDYVWDAAAAVGWVHKHIAEYGGNDKVFVGGTSAGGYLSLMLCFDRKYLDFNKALSIKGEVAGFVHDAGQATTHFNVLSERGFDRRRVVVDEAAPLYYVGVEKEYPPMLFSFAEKDMTNRREQNELIMLTMKHFDYDMSKVDTYTFENSTHSSYVGELDSDGESRFGKVVYDFLKKYI